MQFQLPRAGRLEVASTKTQSPPARTVHYTELKQPAKAGLVFW
jgi:hypothetical protein